MGTKQPVTRLPKRLLVNHMVHAGVPLDQVRQGFGDDLTEHFLLVSLRK